jgi:hypothetical protein
MLARLRAALLEGLFLLAAVASAGGCGKGLPGGSHDTAAKPEGQPAAAIKPAAPAGGAAVSFEATTVKAGSLPGVPGRDPAREADLVAVQLTAFEIDQAPFPNEDGKPIAELDYASASAACTGAGKRLCSELEWEHACGKAGAAENFTRGVREWTLSAGQDVLADARGGGEPARCGARARVERSYKLGFRCCRGAEQASMYPAPRPTANDALGAKPLTFTVERMRKALAGVESLAALAPSFQPFSNSDADAALRKGKRTRDGITAWSFLPSSIAWTPAPAEELVVIAGRSGEQALIAVLYPLGDGTYAHAASAILREPDATVAIATSAATPTPLELLWTSCYGCPNEGGTIRYGDDRRVAIEFR